jgi:ABC-2 type transport system permease protein
MSAGPAGTPVAAAARAKPARPAPAVRSVAALAAMELRLAGRRGENVLVMLVIPVAVLLFFGGTSVLTFDGEPARILVPGAIALAIIAAGLVNLGIATAYERHYGVLKRLGGAPLPRWGFVAAKIIAIFVIEIGQVALLALVGVVAFGWSPGPGWSPIGFGIAFVLGTVTFVSLGLLLAGTLRAEAVLALANGLFLGFLMLGGIILPVGQLPDALQPLAALLPSTALADLLRAALDPTLGIYRSEPRPILVLASWAFVATTLAIRRFHWD